MIDLIPPKITKMKWSPSGITGFIGNFVNTPHPAERIIPAWTIECMMVVGLIIPILLVFW